MKPDDIKEVEKEKGLKKNRRWQHQQHHPRNRKRR